MNRAHWSGPLGLGLACLVLLTALAAPARAGIAAPSTSTVPHRLFICPAGDSVFVVLPRHLSMTPWGEGDVWIDLCGCPGVHLVRSGSNAYTLDAAGCVATLPAHPDGVYPFALEGGGLCPGGTFKVYAGGVLLATDSLLASPDQDGNLVVDDNDLAIARSKLGTHDAGADLDGDGTVTQADLDLLAEHIGHGASGAPVPARLATWGRLKLLYR